MQAKVPALLPGRVLEGVEGCDGGLGVGEPGMPEPGEAVDVFVDVVPTGKPGQRPQYSLQPALQPKEHRFEVLFFVSICMQASPSVLTGLATAVLGSYL